MSLTFKFDKLGGDPEKRDDGKSSVLHTSLDRYSEPGSVRNVCFVEASGRMTFLNYAYLVAGEFRDEGHTITLIFTTHNVLIMGQNLISLFEDFMNHMPRKVAFTSERYTSLMGKNDCFVTDVTVSTNEEERS